VEFPQDNGAPILNAIQRKNNILFGASNASFKNRKAAHAWILSAGSISDIEDPDMHIWGSGPVDGHIPHLSSGRGEVHRIAALTIIAHLFLKYHSSIARVEAVCDSQGIINKCSHASFSKLCSHPKANTDLYFTQYQHAAKTLIQLSWVKSHTNKKPWKSLQDSQHLSIHKVIGPLESGILTTLGYLDRAAYIKSKHGITMEKLEHINLIALKQSLDGKKIPQQTSIVKLIHRWNPTFGSLC
jgi:hypothetical protein